MANYQSIDLVITDQVGPVFYGDGAVPAGKPLGPVSLATRYSHQSSPPISGQGLRPKIGHKPRTDQP
jgi:hypothetical protein